MSHTPPRYNVILLTVFVLTLISSSLQVDVGILFRAFAGRPEQYQIWSNVPPGRCCTPTPSSLGQDEVPNARDGMGYSATIAGLLLGDLGFVYAEKLASTDPQRISNPGCGSAPWQTRVGAGSFIVKDQFNWRTWDYHWVVGVSYITMPKALPSTKEESNWASAQGISMMSIGGGKWLADGVVNPFGFNGKRKIKREAPFYNKGRIEDNYRGEVEWRSPHWFKYPDIVQVDGVNYTDEWRGDLVYKDNQGRVLNLTSFEPM